MAVSVLWDARQLYRMLADFGESVCVVYRLAGSEVIHRMDLKQGDLENIILNALWDLEEEGQERVFVSDIQEKIKSPAKKWAYTTVKTVLDRLVDKDMAERKKDGKKYLYHSVVQRRAAGETALKKVLRQYFKNSPEALLACLQEVVPAEKMLTNKAEARFVSRPSVNGLGTGFQEVLRNPQSPLNPKTAGGRVLQPAASAHK